MLLLSKIGARDKRALSNLVAYVLLIMITLSLSTMVYGWLKFYVETDEVESCPSNVNIIIEDYDCVPGVDGNLTVTLKNKGLFDVDGFVLRVHDREDAEFGFYVFDAEGFEMRTGDSNETVYPFEEYNAENPDYDIRTITLIEVQPFLREGDKVACESYASQRVTCT